MGTLQSFSPEWHGCLPITPNILSRHVAALYLLHISCLRGSRGVNNTRKW
jgi:hypothetical protein